MRSRLRPALIFIVSTIIAACGPNSSNSTSGTSGSETPAGSSGSVSGAASGATTGSAGSTTSGSSASSGGGSTGSAGSSAGGSGSSASSGGSTGSSGSSMSSGSASAGSGGAADDAGLDGTLPGIVPGDGGPCMANSITPDPTLPGAVKSPLYTVTANGTPQFVEKLTKFAPEMQVHYTHFSVPNGCTASISVTVATSFNSVTVSPKSRNIAVTKSGNTFTFQSGPNYLIAQVDSQDLLFILIDAAETNPPQLGDADVKNIMDYKVDATGATLMTSQIQAAINAASGATQDILYFPPGKYLVGELWLKSNMTLYLAAGAILQGSPNTADYNTGTGGLTVENDSHGLIHMLNISDTKILGRGVIDGNGVALRTSVGEGDAGSTGATGAALVNVVKIDGSSNILIDGITTRDSSFWNTIIYQSDKVTIQNYKVINQRPITTTFNQTDGVDFDSSTNGTLFNAFLYTGDDNMATKKELNATINTNNILHQHVVTYSNSGGCKIGTKTGGTLMSGITFDDIDIVKAGRAMAVDGYDTAVIQGLTYENIRVEAADSMLIDIEENNPPTWRTAANTTITKMTTYKNVTSMVDKTVNLHGKSATIDIEGVDFNNLVVQGKHITAPTASWSTGDVTGITFE